MKRGEIYWADLKPRSGSEQKGRRPVLVVSHDGFNQTPNWRSVIVIPLSTSSSQSKRALTVVPIPAATGGLKKEGIAVCHQITTLDRSKLTELIGLLPSAYLAQVEAGILAALDMGN